MEFAVKGYTVFPNVIPEGLVNDLNAEIDSIWEETPGRALIETYQVGGTLKYIPVQKDLKGGPNKLLDVYSFSPAARDVILHPTLVGFLEGLFDDSINVIQSLSFMVGSEQPIHKDTAYVRVQPEMHLAASWIALEDIRPGTGELEYYVGSHRDEDFLFGGREKWSQSHPNEVEKYLESLHVDARNHGHRRERFLARKGDVLIWHADLAHGGSKIIDAKRTRKSLVAHYSPRSATPFCNSPSKITYGNHAFLSSINP